VAKIAAGSSGQDTLSMFSPSDIVGNLLMMTGWGLHIQPLIGVSWAASAEMGSYLLLPLLLSVTVRRSPLVCGLAVLAALLAIVAVSLSGRGSSGPLDVVSGDSFYPLLRAVAGFTLGLAIFRFAGTMDRLSAMAQDGLLAVVLVAILLVEIWAVGDGLLYLLFIPLVALLARDGRLALALFGNAPVYRLGIISYSIYLIHPLFVSFAVQVWRKFGRESADMLNTLRICVYGEDLASFSKEMNKIPSVPAACVEDTHPGRNITPQNLVEDVDINLTKLLLDGHRNFSTSHFFSACHESSVFASCAHTLTRGWDASGHLTLCRRIISLSP